VLLIDSDPQGSLTASLGFPDPDEIPLTLATIMMNIIEEKDFPEEYGMLHHMEGIDLIPANMELSGIEVSLGNILTPNLTEACILTGTEYKVDMDENDLAEICNKLCAMGPKKIVVSGLERGDNLENFIYEGGKEWQTILEHKVGSFRSGTGDVFSTIIAADTVNGVGFADSVRHASSFVAKVLRRTVELDLPKTDGICFEEFLTEI
jgi:pyridoxal/pyridoxine/pyridoxamine kinase